MDQRPLCQRACFHPECSARRRAAAKAVSTEPATVLLAVQVKRQVNAAPVVTNTVAVTNAARQSRWRSKQDVVALRGQAQERMKGLRARRKAGKAVAS